MTLTQDGFMNKQHDIDITKHIAANMESANLPLGAPKALPEPLRRAGATQAAKEGSKGLLDAQGRTTMSEGPPWAIPFLSIPNIS